MRNIVATGFTLVLLLASNAGWTAVTCTELMDKIYANIQGNGVRVYDLQILSNADAELEISQSQNAKIVGSCGGGSQKIVYWRGGKSTGEPTQDASLLQSQAQAEKALPLKVLLANK